MQIHLPPPPPPPTPQDVVDAANAVINEVTGGGSTTNGDAPPGPSSTAGGGTMVLPPGVGVFICPAPPAPFIPVPYPTAFTENTSNHASGDDGTPQGGGTSPGGTSSPGSVNFVTPRPRQHGGIVRRESHALSLAVQAIAIALGQAPGAGSGIPVATVVFIALVPGARGANVPRTEAAVTKIIDAILSRFAAHSRGPGWGGKIQHLRVDLVAAITPGLLLAAASHRIHGNSAEGLARRHLIALLRSGKKHG